eukprot:EG_transcript_30395
MAVALGIVADVLTAAVDDCIALKRLQISVASRSPFWAALLGIERKIELRKYADGYRSSVTRVLANSTYKNAEACEKVWAAGLLPTLLQHTHLDEENPCLREWASFTISNMMLLPQVQDFLRGLRLEGVSVERAPEFDLEKLGLDFRVETDPETGIQTIRTKRPAWACSN